MNRDRTYFDDKAPRRTVWVAAALGAAMALSVLWGATHTRDTAPEPAAVLEPCALVLTRDGQVCR